MPSNPTSRLDKIENKLRAQLEQMQVHAITNVLDTLLAADKASLFRSMAKLATIPVEHKDDPILLSQHFTRMETDLLNKVHGLIQEPPYTVAQEAILTLQVALQACERVRV